MKGDDYWDAVVSVIRQCLACGDYADDVIGTVTEDAAKETGLRSGTIVVAGGTDISSAALGCGVTKAGQAYYSMGTGSNLGMMIPTEKRKDEYRILKWPHVIEGITMFDAPMAFTGASLNWYRDTFADHEVLMASKAGLNVFSIFDKYAMASEPGSGGLLYLPYMGNTLSPNWNESSKGVFFGATIATSKADFIRALMEGVAFDLYSNIKIAKASGAVIDDLTLNGGPTKSPFWNKITADVTGIPLKLTNVDEAAPLGDAILAAKGAGLYKSLTEPHENGLIKVVDQVEPDMKLHDMYMDFFEIWQRVYNNLKGEMEDLHKLQFKYNMGKKN